MLVKLRLENLVLKFENRSLDLLSEESFWECSLSVSKNVAWRHFGDRDSILYILRHDNFCISIFVRLIAALGKHVTILVMPTTLWVYCHIKQLQCFQHFLFSNRLQWFEKNGKFSNDYNVLGHGKVLFSQLMCHVSFDFF